MALTEYMHQSKLEKQGATSMLFVCLEVLRGPITKKNKSLRRSDNTSMSHTVVTISAEWPEGAISDRTPPKVTAFDAGAAVIEDITDEELNIEDTVEEGFYQRSERDYHNSGNMEVDE